jgi:hypothetical protein
MTNGGRKWNLAVLGSASGKVDSIQHDQAFVIGKTIAEAGGVLLTGGCPGLPYAAVQGAMAKAGLAIGISPANHIIEHEEMYQYPVGKQILIFTGMGRKGRNVILVRSADACIFVGGGMGTLNEFTIAVDELGKDKAIGILSGSGGFADEFPRILGLHQKTVLPRIVQDKSPETLVGRILSHLHESLNHE